MAQLGQVMTTNNLHSFYFHIFHSASFFHIMTIKFYHNIINASLLHSEC